jgi:two-component SAPR family response regulator
MIERVNAAGTKQAMAFGQYTLGTVLCEQGEFAKAQQAFDKGREYGTSMQNGYFEAVYQFCTALSHLRQGDRDTAGRQVGDALAIARKQGYITIPWIGWYRSAFTELLQLALEYDNEPEYSRLLIKAHHLTPKIPPTHLEHWPWPVKIYALGRFEIETIESEKTSSRKVEKRPLELLKIILAAGPEGILAEKAVDELVPDNNSKSAYNIYSVTLHRLRQRLGDEKYLLTDNGRLSLNPDHCWIDAWQFARLSPRESHRPAGKEPVDLHIKRLDQAIALYQGEFLAGQAGTTEQLTYAESLNRKFINTIFAKALLSEKKGAWEKAIQCYQQGLQQMPQHEPFYRAIMFCYGQFGYSDGIRQTYQLCKNSLARSLDALPSTETEKLYRKLLG